MLLQDSFTACVPGTKKETQCKNAYEDIWGKQENRGIGSRLVSLLGNGVTRRTDPPAQRGY